MRSAARGLSRGAVCAVTLMGWMYSLQTAAANEDAAHALADKFSRAAEDGERADEARKQAAARAKAQAEAKARAEARARADAEARAQAEAKAQAARQAAEQRAADEAEMLRNAEEEAEARRREQFAREQQQLIEDRRRAARADAQRIAEEARQQQDEVQRQAEEARRAEAERLTREVEAQRLAEEKRIAEEKLLAEERRIAEEKRRAEEAHIAEAKRLAAQAEAKRLAEEARTAELQRQAKEAEARRQAEEARLAEQRRIEEARAREEAADQRATLEAAREAEARRIAEKFRLARQARERNRETRDMETRNSLGGPQPERAQPSPFIDTPATAQATYPQRVTVLVIMQPRRHGFAGKRMTANPVLCVGQSCYVSNGPASPATVMRRAQALGPGNTLGRNAWVCRNQTTCVFRGVTLPAPLTTIQPVDMGFLRHARREIRTVEPDGSCDASAGALSCSAPIVSAGYRAWIVPEAVAAAAGARALERALDDGLPAARSASYGGWDPAVHALPTR